MRNAEAARRARWYYLELVYCYCGATGGKENLVDVLVRAIMFIFSTILV